MWTQADDTIKAVVFFRAGNTAVGRKMHAAAATRGAISGLVLHNDDATHFTKRINIRLVDRLRSTQWTVLWIKKIGEKPVFARRSPVSPVSEFGRRDVGGSLVDRRPGSQEFVWIRCLGIR